MTKADLWTCPECERRFANRDQTHSCGRYSVEERLEGKSSQVISMYEEFAKLVKSCGPVEIAPAKTRIGFQVRMIFAVVSVNNSGLACHVVLSRRLENPRFTRIESLSPRNHVHHFRIRVLEDLDDEVAAWLKEAYQVGEQKHHRR